MFHTNATATQMKGTITAMKILAKNGNKIPAIALWRAITGDGLETAMRVYELIMEVLP